MAKNARRGRREGMPSTRNCGAATLRQTRTSPASDVDSIGESDVDTAEDEKRKATKAVATTVRRCFASFRSALSTQQAQTAELTRLLQICASKLDQQSVTMEKLLLDSAADAETFSALKTQLGSVGATAQNAMVKNSGQVDDDDAMPWLVSIRVSSMMT